MRTVHQLRSVVERVRKGPGKESTNAKKAREAFGGAYEKEMPIPLCTEDFNRNMGDVDIANQLRSYYDTQLTSFCTWWPMLCWAYDTMITNSYVIFSDMLQSPDAITQGVSSTVCLGRALDKS